MLKELSGSSILYTDTKLVVFCTYQLLTSTAIRAADMSLLKNLTSSICPFQNRVPPPHLPNRSCWVPSYWMAPNVHGVEAVWLPLMNTVNALGDLTSDTCCQVLAVSVKDTVAEAPCVLKHVNWYWFVKLAFCCTTQLRTPGMWLLSMSVADGD